MKIETAVIGCGPYGLAAAAHLREAGREVRVFGKPLQFWCQQMPIGMYLRSAWYACNIGDPKERFTLEMFQKTHSLPFENPVRLDTFVSYGDWFQQNAVPEIDQRMIQEVSRNELGFRLRFDTGETIHCQRVVVAAGIGRFAHKPAIFDELADSPLVSHSSDHRDLSKFAGLRVAVIGGGQSAFESAALLHEAGAEVELIMRGAKKIWLREKRATRRHIGWLRRLVDPLTDVGPQGLTQIVSSPRLLFGFPRKLRDAMVYRAIRPSAAAWLKGRLSSVKTSTGLRVGSATRKGDHVTITLSDGTSRTVDHALLATGFRVEVSRYGFLSSEILANIKTADGYPCLGAGFESNIAGLHFLGAPGVHSYGPLVRFVAGTAYSGAQLTRHVLAQ